MKSKADTRHAKEKHANWGPKKKKRKRKKTRRLKFRRFELIKK